MTLNAGNCLAFKGMQALPLEVIASIQRILELEPNNADPMDLLETLHGELQRDHDPDRMQDIQELISVR
jgi:hypothetical protein